MTCLTKYYISHFSPKMTSMNKICKQTAATFLEAAVSCQPQKIPQDTSWMQSFYLFIFQQQCWPQVEYCGRRERKLEHWWDPLSPSIISAPSMYYIAPGTLIKTLSPPCTTYTHKKNVLLMKRREAVTLIRGTNLPYSIIWVLNEYIVLQSTNYKENGGK